MEQGIVDWKVKKKNDINFLRCVIKMIVTSSMETNLTILPLRFAAQWKTVKVVELVPT